MATGGYLGGSSIFYASRPRFKHGAKPITSEEQKRFEHVTIDVGKIRKLKRKSLVQRLEILRTIKAEASMNRDIDVKQLDAELEKLTRILGVPSKKPKRKRGRMRK